MHPLWIVALKFGGALGFLALCGLIICAWSRYRYNRYLRYLANAMQREEQGSGPGYDETYWQARTTVNLAHAFDRVEAAKLYLGEGK